MSLAAVIPELEVYGRVMIAIMRWLMPILTAVLLFRCIKPLVSFRR